MANVMGGKGNPSFTGEEIADEFELNWVGIDEAQKLLEGDSPTDYEGRFIKERDTVFIREAIKLLK